MEPTAALGTAVSGASDMLVALLMRQENLYLMAATYALLTTVQKVLPPEWNDHHWAVRMAPLYPLILCSIGVWIPGQQPVDMSGGSKVIVGIILGWACGHLHKVWKQTVRGKDERIERARVKRNVTVIDGESGQETPKE